ncbi:MAG TPA: triple tyrosine motif-containing protein [Chitinophagaceae bacterium]|nr:triple tyrosine motif-containing protein [Chitinophagaceae bacterium]
MKRLIYIKLFLLAILSCSMLLSQQLSRYNTFSYNVNEGLLQSTIGEIAFDKNNFCWISFPNGIQRFDGKNFFTVPLQPGLADNKHCDFFKCSNDVLLVSHSRGLSRYEADGNKFTAVYTYEAGSKSPAQFIGEDERSIYIYTQSAEIIGISLKDYSVSSRIKTGFPDYGPNSDYRPSIGDNIAGHKAVWRIAEFIYLWDLKNKKLVAKSPAIASLSSFFLHLKNENEVYYYTYKTSDASIEIYNFATHSNKTLPVRIPLNGYIGRFCIYHWGAKTLVSLNDRLFEADTSGLKLMSEIVDFQNQPVALNNPIAGIYEDNFGNLYLQTVSGGIRKIIRNNYPLKYYNNGEAKKNFIMAVLPDKSNNRILAGARGNGILVYDTLQRLQKHIKFITRTGAVASPNAILKKPDGNYIVFAQGEKKVWELSSDLSGIRSIPITSKLPKTKSGANYFSDHLMQSDNGSVIQQETNLFRVGFYPLTVQEEKITDGYTMGGLYYPPYIITHANNELIFLDAKTSAPLKKISFKNTGYVRCFATDNKNNIYIGSNKGIFVIDTAAKILQQFNKETGLPDECIYAMDLDAENNLWCSTNKGILKIKNGKVVHQLKKEDGLQENEFNTNVTSKAADGELFFGGVNGVSSFFPAAIGGQEENLSLIFTRILANNQDAIKDTAAWKIDKLVLPYTHNSLSFDFVAMGNQNPDQYLYQYQMVKIDKEWIRSDGMQTIRYSLPPGRYVLKIYASRSLDDTPTPLKELVIIIRPPFWKSWWFMVLAGVLIVSLLAYIINQNNKRKFEKRLQQLENERQLKEERERISKDLHDSLGAYANAVLYNTELLEKESVASRQKELIGDLKFASKDIITSLRETVWALKKETYSAEDCLLRIRNFVQPLSRYYHKINFTLEGEAPATLELHYTKALALVRIVQEAIANAIKHSGAENISLLSQTSSAGKWHITVKDDGKGFQYTDTKTNSEGNGLTNMEQRAAEASIHYTIESVVGKGTTIQIII